MSRRELLRRASNGFGTLALGTLLSRASTPSLSGASKTVTDTPVSSLPHHRARARSVIFLFMEGAVSQVDSFDHKPMLEKYHGQDARKAMGRIEKTQFDSIGKILKSPWTFRQHGQSDLWISDLFPHIARQADDLCVLRSMTSTFPEHTSANYFLHSGIGLQGRPSMGAWVNYGLGSLNDNLPGYVVLNGGQIPSGGLDNFGSGFLPATFQGSLLQAHGTPLANVVPSEKQSRLQQTKQRLVRRLNEHGLDFGSNDGLLKRRGTRDGLWRESCERCRHREHDKCDHDFEHHRGAEVRDLSPLQRTPGGSRQRDNDRNERNLHNERTAELGLENLRQIIHKKPGLYQAGYDDDGQSQLSNA